MAGDREGDQARGGGNLLHKPKREEQAELGPTERRGGWNRLRGH